MFGRFCEIVQPDYTHKVVQHSTVQSLARLDRIYLDMPSHDLLGPRPMSGVCWPVTDPELPPDHCP
eukprot:3963507-Pyramimonas_sp.AAC.1